MTVADYKAFDPQRLTGRISTLRISRTVRIAISGLGRTLSSHNTAAIFCTSPRRSPTDFYHPPHSLVHPTICTGPTPIPTPITLNPRPNERSRICSPPGLKNREPAPLLRKPKSSYFPSYKLDSSEFERRNGLLGLSLIDWQSIGRTMTRRLQPWT